MAETARIHEPEPSVLEPKPALQLVHGTAGAGASSEAAMPNVGRTAMIGYLVGFGASLGLGAFVGIWGGGGFGFMMGGTVPLARHLDAQSARSTHHGQGETHGTAAR